MKPYYEHAGITIYHGDCREILPQLGQVETILTDPPWVLQREIMAGNLDAVSLWESVAPLLRARRLVLWLPIVHDPRSWLNPLADWPYLRQVYIRRAIPGYFGRALMDGEIVHVLGTYPPAKKGRMVIPGGLAITYISTDRVDGHPGPRSEIVCNWLIRWWCDESVIDPFMGSGTTLTSAKKLGRRAIGIELEEKYCEIAAKRLSQEVLNLQEL
jgi:DNA modification methylase